jgi:adenosine deaminase
MLNSDDPAMMGLDLTDEYVAVAVAFNLSIDQVEQISLAGIDASWAPANEQATLRQRFRSEFAALRHEFAMTSSEPTSG